MFFLLIRNPGDKGAIFHVSLASVLVSVLLLIPWTVSIAVGNAWVGEVIDESLLLILFGFGVLLTFDSVRTCCSARLRSMSARPMLRVWGGFMFLAHLSFLCMYVVRAALPNSESREAQFDFFLSFFFFFLFKSLFQLDLVCTSQSTPRIIFCIRLFSCMWCSATRVIGKNTEPFFLTCTW
jgi:hypothetical protein